MKSVSRFHFPLALVLALAISGSAFSQAKKSRNEQVIDDRTELKDSDTWIYNDLPAATEAARAAGKPLMIVFRCIP